MKILALDLGKIKTVACIFDSRTTKERYVKAPGTPERLHDLIVAERPRRVVFEIGPRAGWVHDLVAALDIAVEVANPTHEGWRWRNVKRKTDRLDALKLARLSAAAQLPQVRIPSRRVRQRKSLVAYRQIVVDRRSQSKNRIRGLLHEQAMSLPVGKKAWTAAALEELSAVARPLEQCDPCQLWRGQLYEELQALTTAHEQVMRVEARLNALNQADSQVRLLETIPGVGPRTAEIISVVLDDPRRFANGKQVASYAGLVPRLFASGQSCRTGGITKQGNGLLRKLLVEASWVGLRYNPWLREIYLRVRRGSAKRNKIAIVATARHLLIAAWAMMRDGQRWRPPPMPDNASAAA